MQTYFWRFSKKILTFLSCKFVFNPLLFSSLLSIVLKKGKPVMKYLPFLLMLLACGGDNPVATNQQQTTIEYEFWGQAPYTIRYHNLSNVVVTESIEGDQNITTTRQVTYDFDGPLEACMMDLTHHEGKNITIKVTNVSTKNVIYHLDVWNGPPEQVCAQFTID